jgi:serine/threonine protein kinase
MPGVTPPSYTITLTVLSNLMVAGTKPSLIGQKVRGRYLVESRIGGGTFGTVYKVVDLESSRWVDGHVRRALKVIDVADPNRPRIPPSDYVNQRLRNAAREAYYHQLVSSHPNIVTLHEYFLIADRAEMFLVLDYFPGGDLLTYMDEGRNPFAGDDKRMREIILQICDALDFVHSKGVFHKDLKPQNILVSRDGRKVFLCDFGLSSDTQTNTRGGGTKAYMSPGKESHSTTPCAR